MPDTNLDKRNKVLAHLDGSQNSRFLNWRASLEPALFDKLAWEAVLSGFSQHSGLCMRLKAQLMLPFADPVGAFSSKAELRRGFNATGLLNPVLTNAQEQGPAHCLVP